MIHFKSNLRSNIYFNIQVIEGITTHNDVINMSKTNSLFKFMGLQVDTLLQSLLSKKSDDKFIYHSEQACWKNIVATSGKKADEQGMTFFLIV